MILVQLVPNIPQEMCLRQAEAVELAGAFCYVLEDGRVLALDPGSAEMFRLLKLQAGEMFGVCHRWSGSPDQAPYVELYLSPQTERRRAAQDIRQETGVDLTPVLERSIEIVNARKGAARSSTAVPGDDAGKRKTTPAKTATGSSGRLPFNVALKEIVGFTTETLQQCHQHWGDAATQDLISTIVIAVGKMGYLTMWERDEAEGLTAA